MAQSRRRTKGKQNKPKRTSGRQNSQRKLFSGEHPTDQQKRTAPKQQTKPRDHDIGEQTGTEPGTRRRQQKQKHNEANARTAHKPPKKGSNQQNKRKNKRTKKNSGDKLWPETCRAPQAGHPSIARKQTKRGRENEKKKQHGRGDEALFQASTAYKTARTAHQDVNDRSPVPTNT